MDSFMDKLAQKLNAQEMIKANSEAETAELERMRQQMEEYDKCLQEMRKLTLSSTESSDKVKELIDQLDASKESLVKQIESLNADAYDVVHKENVKVYRNVQAVIQEESIAIQNEVKKVKKSVNGKFVVALVFAILGFVAAGCDLAFNLLQYFKVF